MGKWGYQGRELGLHQKEAGWRSWTPGRRPPSPVAPWEIKFCSQIPWKKFCKDKKLIYLFENVLKWDDSAGKQAFDNAKARYWAEINGLPCDIPLPNPDVHIDVVDQYNYIDPQLLKDLYEKTSPPPHKELPDYSSVEIIPTGWDVEDPSTEGDAIPRFISTKHSGCNVNNDADDAAINQEDPITEKNTAEDTMIIVPTGWGDEEDFGSGHACVQPGRQSNGAFNHVGSSNSGWQHKPWCDGKDNYREHVEYKNLTNRSYGNRRDTSYSIDLSGRRKNYTDEHWLHGNPSFAYAVHQRSASCGGVWYWHKSAS